MRIEFRCRECTVVFSVKIATPGIRCNDYIKKVAKVSCKCGAKTKSMQVMAHVTDD